MTLGKQIVIARKKAGMKAYELASMISRSTAVMSDIENDKLKGNVSPDLLISIAAALNAPEMLLQHCRECPVDNMSCYNIVQSQTIFSMIRLRLF